MNPDLHTGVFGFFRDFGVRETIESILIAVVLALMFRAFEAEAFIIPTGSMAPTLQGQHMDVHCDKCDYRYRAGASSENTTYAPQDRIPVERTICPICGYRMHMDRVNDPTQRSNNGDRILVNKFVYDFATPKRWDVIVFKNPNNGKQNYIKRLIGLPGESIIIENGDIFIVEPDHSGRRIARKPEDKIRVMLQLVDDTHHLAKDLIDADWPLRWQQWRGAQKWQSQMADDQLNYFISASDEENWLRYRHLKPRTSDWQTLENLSLPTHIKQNQNGELITDHYGYNEIDLSNRNVLGQLLTRGPGRLQQRSDNAHWVGDLAFECEAEVQSPSGTIKLDLVEGGAHFTCSIDVASGRATLESSDESVTFLDTQGSPVEAPTAQTRLKGSGKYKLLYANVDDQIHLWINNAYARFDAPQFERTSPSLPTYTPEDPGDAEPLGIAAVGVDMSIDRLKVLRDIYYTSARGERANIMNETGVPLQRLRELHRSPELWNEPAAQKVFQMGKNIQKPMFELQADQFLPMGDNSPASLDGRVWAGPKYVGRDMLIGRAMLIYWPHTLHTPIPFVTPNFGDMKFIR